jgi:hypothetical protein
LAFGHPVPLHNGAPRQPYRAKQCRSGRRRGGCGARSPSSALAVLMLASKRLVLSLLSLLVQEYKF